MNAQKSNHLIHENSPYLLQHAGNPVDWYPWGKEALEKARKENKLLLISIGYAACHWCHVMEKECFEDQEVALMMNDHFVSVKVDREERPDIDQLYMNACVMMTGRGGWPLNVIALPDQLGGGFSRYSVDGSWLVPHFEKMLYDNAQLVTLYARAYQKRKQSLYRRIVEQTLEWIAREMTSPDGLWYSSLDADSEGAEGTYYTWTASEVDGILEKEAEKIKQYYGITSDGNWEEGKNVLHIPAYQEIEEELEPIRRQLLQIRANRIAPALDDKVITSWNGMMIKGLVHAWQGTGNPEYLNVAIRAGNFYRQAIVKNSGGIFRIWKNNRFSIPGFLDDYAYLITAFVELYEATFNNAWLKVAGRLIEYVQLNFGEAGSPLLRLTSTEVTTLIDTPVETTDQVIPSSNSEIANGLYRYGLITGDEKLQEQAMKMLSGIISQLNKHPLIYGNWGMLLIDYLVRPMEVAIVGENYKTILGEFSSHYLPGALFYGGSDDTGPESLKGKFVQGKTLIYLCRGKSCLAPVESVREALGLMDEW
ncbi:MAG: thioredoxin domain-containing protein [Bacteroidia bacterium]|nr:thioredoxin domain-containing protein [Bacteroidia bacterium]